MGATHFIPMNPIWERAIQLTAAYQAAKKKTIKESKKARFACAYRHGSLRFSNKWSPKKQTVSKEAA